MAHLLPPFSSLADLYECKLTPTLLAPIHALTIPSSPTALDALAFAYLHTLLHTHDDLRIEVAKRVNLVTWERRVYEAVRGAFVPC